MTVGQVAIENIFVVGATAWVVWHFMFMPRLRELEERLAKEMVRREAAEHIIRNQEKDTIKIIGEFGDPMEMLGDWDDS